MENPTAVVKSAVQPASLLRWFIVGAIGFAVLDLLNWTDYLLYPVTSLRARFGSQSS